MDILKFMTSIRLCLIIFLCLSLFKSEAQDSLLLTNGKIRALNGVVVYYDNDDVLYQNDRQRARMKAYISRKEARKKAKPQTEETKESKADAKRKEKRALALTKRKEEFEEKVKLKIEQLSPADFETWKTKELDRIRQMEKERELNEALDEQLANARKSRKEARERERFTKRVARDLVFSVLKADSTEVIVYNADTLGFFGDGEAEVEYGVEEMRAYIKGQQAGRKHKTTFDMLMGVAVGAISSGAGAYWGPSIPAGYIIVTSIANTKIKNKAGIDQGLLDDNAFRDGYERAAKRKKTWNFVKGSVAGLGFGILMWDGIVRGEGLPGPR